MYHRDSPTFSSTLQHVLYNKNQENLDPLSRRVEVELVLLRSENHVSSGLQKTSLINNSL